MLNFLIGVTFILKALDGQTISIEPVRYMFIERLLTGDVKANFTQATLSIDIRTVDNINKLPAEMTKHTFPAYCPMLKIGRRKTWVK